MTSLIDVIFLLLLFFMLTSTFTRFSEVELLSAASGATVSEQTPIFLRMTEEGLSLNGQPVVLDALQERLQNRLSDTDAEQALLLVSPSKEVTSQRLVDVLVELRKLPEISVSVLGGGG